MSDKFFFKGRQDARQHHTAYGGFQTNASQKSGSRKYPLTLVVTSEARKQEVEAQVARAKLHATISVDTREGAVESINELTALLNMDRGQFNLPECKVRKLSLPKNHSREDLQRFQAAFAALMAEYGVTRVAIKERMPKGKFAGGAISFKMEAAIQLITGIELTVTMLPPALIKSTLAANPLPIGFADTGLKVFQETAFTAAYVGQLQGR